jgi:CHASE2 domain-containing sensor protein
MLGTLLGGRYKIITVLGSGGFGQTFLAEDTQKVGHPQCVIKQFKPATQDSRFLEIARRLFHKEVEMLARLGQHDQIPELYGSFEDGQEFYLVQEFIDGTPLSDEFIRVGRLNEPEAVALLKDVLSVLEFVHSHRVIHRDIKPANLIRRHRDGKIVLIDFGAVKEIQTQLVGGTGQTSFTVGIGTQGYTPGEQLAGRPRFCSDIYALGITTIQALTGLQPSQFEEDPNTSEILWHGRVHISPALGFILDRMVRYHFKQRYQSAADVLNALQKMAELPTDLTEVSPSLLLPESLLKGETILTPESWRDRLKQGLQIVAIATIAVTGLIAGLRQLSWLEPLELRAYDQMVRLRGDAPPDPRLLTVAITERDLQTLKRPTPSDADVAKVIANLQRYRPRVIGLDLYRDLPQQPGQEQLLQQLRASNVVAILNLGSPPESTKVPPPPTVPNDRIGFNDFLIDPDGVIRRSLLFATADKVVYHAFSLRLALKYLAAEGIVPINSPRDRDLIAINGVTFPALNPSDGGYQYADTRGYQILLDYQAAEQVAPKISFTDVLEGKIDPKLVSGKIILIGTTAPSGKDLFATPYSAGRRDNFQMPGVVVHTQMVSHLLKVVLDKQPLFWFFSNWAELIWIASWSLIGGSIAWWMRHPLLLGVNTVAVGVILFGMSFILFLNYAWIPVVAPGIALLVSVSVVAVYRSYQVQREQQQLNSLFWQDRFPDYSDEKTRPKLFHRPSPKDTDWASPKDADLSTRQRRLRNERFRDEIDEDED